MTNAAFDLCFPDASTLNLDDCSADSVEQAFNIFQSHGFVILRNVLGATGTHEVRRVCEALHQAIRQQDPKSQGNRNPGRYSIGASVGPGQCFHLTPFTKHLMGNQFVISVLERIYHADGFEITGLGGDYCSGDVFDFQKLHSDKSAARPLARPFKQDPQLGPIHDKETPPMVSVNYVIQDLHQFNGAMRIIPWSEMQAFGREKCAPGLEEEDRFSRQWLQSKIFPLEAGSALVRDIRVWHGGCPNGSGQPRFLPALEVMSQRYFQWQQRASNASRHGRPLLPRTLYERLPANVQEHSKHIIASNKDEVSRRIDDTSWLRQGFVRKPQGGVNAFTLKAAVGAREAFIRKFPAGITPVHASLLLAKPSNAWDTRKITGDDAGTCTGQKLTPLTTKRKSSISYPIGAKRPKEQDARTHAQGSITSRGPCTSATSNSLKAQTMSRESGAITFTGKRYGYILPTTATSHDEAVFVLPSEFPAWRIPNVGTVCSFERGQFKDGMPKAEKVIVEGGDEYKWEPETMPSAMKMHLLTVLRASPGEHLTVVKQRWEHKVGEAVDVHRYGYTKFRSIVEELGATVYMKGPGAVIGKMP